MQSKIIDLHQDLLAHINHKKRYNQSDQTDWDALRRNNVKVVVATAFPLPVDENWHDPITNDLIEKDFLEYVEYCDNNDDYEIVKSGDDMERIVQSDDLHGVVMHIEGFNVLPGQERLEKWYQLGWRSLGIVWNVSNDFGGGTKDPTKGLTQRGKEMISWLSDKNMIVDFAHMNQATFWDVADCYKGPIVVSHGNACALRENPRNYTDNQLSAIKKRDGVIGVFFARTYVTGTDRATLEDVADHIDYLVEKIGVKHIALGTDFGGIVTGLVEGLSHLDELPAFFAELTRRGYTQEDLDAIAYQNALRVYSSILDGT